MSGPRVHSIMCANPYGLHRMAYYEWGDPDCEDLVLCVHGLTRTGRDFDVLAQRLAKRFRVVCPDVVGRGLSDWLSYPAAYAVPQYAADMVTLLGRLKPKTLRWVGTSMGGLIGLTYAGLVAQAMIPAFKTPPARREATIDDPVIPIEQLVLNDVGPRVEPVSLARIGQYLSEPVAFESYDEAVQYMRQTAASFGPHSDAQWDMLTRHYFVPVDGKWLKHYDPNIAAPFASATAELLSQGEMLLWQAYRSVKAPTLIVHGADSDLLSEQTVQGMLDANPLAKVYSVKGVGHAPSLIVDDQVHAVVEFLSNH